MSKYDPLQHFLEGSTTEEVPLTFAEIEQILGSELPASKGYPAWWSNNPTNNVMTRAWLAAGYRTERVDVTGGKRGFRRDRSSGAKSGSSLRAVRTGKPGLVDRLQAALGGTVHVPDGVDLTEPTGEAWDADR